MNKKIILPLIAILVVIGVGIAYYFDSSSLSQDSNLTIADMVGRTVVVPGNVENVVATSPPMTTMVYMIAPDKLVGINFAWSDTELKYVADAYRNLPVVGGWFGRQDGNYEEIIASGPDIIIEGAMGVDLSTVNERQEKFGTIPVIGVTDNSDVTKIVPSIEFMGKLLGAEERANKLVDFTNTYLDKTESVTNSIPENEKKKVYYAEGEEGLQTDPSGSLHGQLIDICGGKNVADVQLQDGVGQVEVSMEQVINWNPEVIITTDSEFYDSVYTNSKWANIDAVKNKQVYLSPSSPFKWFDRPPGANIIIGIPWTAKVLYPDKYNDIDLKKITKEFYRDFYNYDLSDIDVLSILKNSGLKEENM
ncbi:vitamin B12-binding protein [Methanobrevibacter cuticularis]|uniref:Vitamin B12-binding protein n=1 Tax=Methanobrevibacter cuticularis TaxID=47311 RepID=A0A166D3Y7_9EURY|nr:iron ABC transporter substrate-binding protein [Methanobrevibacter cuticularis]KZX15178.1 vitamin B12-binding protein [Methanobrevibacter cuticularis]